MHHASYDQGGMYEDRMGGGMYDDRMGGGMGRMEYGSEPGYPGTPYGYSTSGRMTPSRHMSTPGGYREELDLPETFYAEEQSYNPMSSSAMVPYSRSRRRSSVSFVGGRPPSLNLDPYRRPSNMNVKFKFKGSLIAGVPLLEAQSRHIRLSGNDDYTLQDLHADNRRCLLLKVKWVNFNSVTYEIPLDHYERRVSLATLARRVSRACVHYLQSNMVPVPLERIELHHLEEIAYGTWQPMLCVR